MTRSKILPVVLVSAALFLLLLNSRYLKFLTTGKKGGKETEQSQVELRMELAQEKNRTQAALAANEMLLQKLRDTPVQSDTAPAEEMFTADTYPESVCSVFSKQLPTTMELWRSHLSKIFEMSRHPMDPKYFFHDLTAQLLHVVTADRLQRSIKTLPHDLETLKRVITKAFHRWVFLQQQQNGSLQEGSDDEPPKVQILVMGGSVAVGDQCRYRGFPGQMPRRKCAWPFRVVSLLNAVLGGEVFELHDAAIGGTNTEAALTLLDYELLPLSDPDVIIHAYATNDMHLYTIQGAENRNQTLRQSVMELTERFVRKVLTPRPCQNTPLLVHFDDYVGNQQRVILDTTVLSQSIQILANYYGFISVSYPDVVRDIVYGDTREHWFSPVGWYPRENGHMDLEIHPSMGMHITASWVLAFNAANLLTHYCSSGLASATESPTNGEADEELGYKTGKGLPPLRGDHDYSYRKPRALPKGFPPNLTSGLTLEDISESWRSIPSPPSGTCNQTMQKRCITSWASHLSVHTESQLNETMSPYLVQNNGWKPVFDFKKLGFVPTGGLHSSFTMEFRNLTQPIRSVTWMTMKSYGEKWAQSLVQMHAHWKAENMVGWSELNLTNAKISGFHNKQTSESYSNTIHIEPRPVGSDLRLLMEVVGGTTFKIMGMAVCG